MFSPISPLPVQQQFADLLRTARRSRHLSQRALALQAGVSARHLCCLENAQAMPSREMVQSLADTLDLPLAQCNALHMAAGFAPPFGQQGLQEAQASHVQQALDFVLRQQEPYPCIVIDGGWNIVRRNDAAQRIFSPFHQAYEEQGEFANNAMHVVFHPGGLKPFIRNWSEFATAWLQLLHREIAQGSLQAAKLMHEMAEYPELPRLGQRPINTSASPILTLQLELNGQRLAFFSTLTRFALPQDASLQEIKIECYYPADEATEKLCRQHYEGTHHA
jgi:transcriptional regulator with XRE-family HTH domain